MREIIPKNKNKVVEVNATEWEFYCGRRSAPAGAEATSTGHRHPATTGPALRHRDVRAIEPPWQAIRELIPADDGEPSFDLFDQRPDSGKPVEISLEDAYTLVLDSD